MPFLTAGYPDREECLSLLVGMADLGSDVIELGLPFSDPVADGPTIQRASERALAGGMTLEGALDLARRFRCSRDTPLVLFTYLNPLLRRGVTESACAVFESGVDGILICDLPADEAPEIRHAFQRVGLDTVALVAPTSSEERVCRATDAASGFVYLIARTGVTGAGGGLSGVVEQSALIRRYSRLPIAVGFGVAEPQQVRALADVADAVVVGSAFLDHIEAGGAREGLQFLRSLREAADAVSLSAPV